MEDLIKALKILIKYGNPKYPFVCTHDKLYIVNIPIENINNDDVKELDDLGIIVDKENDEIYSFKYGSS